MRVVFFLWCCASAGRAASLCCVHLGHDVCLCVQMCFERAQHQQAVLLLRVVPVCSLCLFFQSRLFGALSFILMLLLLSFGPLCIFFWRDVTAVGFGLRSPHESRLPLVWIVECITPFPRGCW